MAVEILKFVFLSKSNPKDQVSDSNIYSITFNLNLSLRLPTLTNNYQWITTKQPSEWVGKFLGFKSFANYYRSPIERVQQTTNNVTEWTALKRKDYSVCTLVHVLELQQTSTVRLQLFSIEGYSY